MKNRMNEALFSPTLLAEVPRTSRLLVHLRSAHRDGERKTTESLLRSLTLSLQAEMTAQERVFLHSFRRLYPFLRRKIYRLLELHRSIDVTLDDLDRTFSEASDEWGARIAHLGRLLRERREVLREVILKPLFALDTVAREWLTQTYRNARDSFMQSVLCTFLPDTPGARYAQ